MTERIKFLMDEHIPRAVTDGLLRRGIDVVTVFESGMSGANDKDLLELAQRLGHVLFTLDEDFLQIHSTGIAHRGIVYTHQQNASIGDMIFGLVLIYEVLESNEMVDHIEFL